MATVLNWLQDNKSWVFSGAGFVILGGLFRILRRRTPEKTAGVVVQISMLQSAERIGENQSLPKDQSAVPIERVSALRFADIKAAIDAAPPLHRQETAKRYVGLHVEWDVRLRSAEASESGLVTLILALGPARTNEGGDLIMCRVQLDEYRELGILPTDSPVRVAGTIKSVKQTYIELDPVRLQFLDSERKL